ncbi:hypothetical protein ACVV7P_004131, partial [Cronobacter sakazakii]
SLDGTRSLVIQGITLTFEAMYHNELSILCIHNPQNDLSNDHFLVRIEEKVLDKIWPTQL